MSMWRFSQFIYTTTMLRRYLWGRIGSKINCKTHFLTHILNKPRVYSKSTTDSHTFVSLHLMIHQFYLTHMFITHPSERKIHFEHMIKKFEFCWAQHDNVMTFFLECWYSFCQQKKLSSSVKHTHENMKKKTSATPIMNEQDKHKAIKKKL